MSLTRADILDVYAIGSSGRRIIGSSEENNPALRCVKCPLIPNSLARSQWREHSARETSWAEGITASLAWQGDGSTASIKMLQVFAAPMLERS